jgi:uncharacterized protein YuzE
MSETYFQYAKWQDYFLKLGNDERKLFKEPTRTHAKGLDWDDMVYRYDSVNDTFRLFFIKTTKDMEQKSIQLTDDVKAGTDSKGKILYLEFQQASKTLGCHLLDYPLPLDDWPACTLHWSYDANEDALDVHFMSQTLVSARFHHNQQSTKPLHYDVIFDKDKNDRYISIEILRASNLLRKRSL